MNHHIRLSKGEVLFQQGDMGDQAYLIETGKLQIKAIRKGVELMLNEIGTGEMVGELALIDGGPRTATVVAMEDTELKSITKSQISERIKSADPVLALLMRQTLRHLRREISGGQMPEERPATTIDQIRLEVDLSGAVERKELELWYQPIVDVESCQLAGFEALVRWRHPQRGLLPPDLFINLAEESGLIVPIGAWVMREAVAGLAQIDAVMGDGVQRFMSVNVSAVQLEATGFLETVREAVQGLPRDRLHLEMTESMLIQSHGAREVIQACHQLGVGLFLDDFGTGYSSLAYLNQLPFDALKIDRAFTMQMKQDDGLKLVRAMINLADGLDRGVVLEGIETAEQRDLYRGLGGKLCQGYFFSKPLAMDRLEVLLRNPAAMPWR